MAKADKQAVDMLRCEVANGKISENRAAREMVRETGGHLSENRARNVITRR